MSIFHRKHELHFGKREQQATTLFNTEKNTHVLIFGDSNSLCSDDKAECWPILLCEKKPEKLRVYNESCNGRTTRFEKGELNGVSMFSKKLKKFSCLDYIIFMIGTNDLKNRYASSVDAISEGMGWIVDKAISSNISASIILLAPPPMGSVSSEEFAGRAELIARLSREYQKLADIRNIEFIDIYNVLDAGRHLQDDNIHLNASGRIRVADLIWRAI